jgi:biotin-(acetyl-CoA carboxylase) ligase
VSASVPPESGERPEAAAPQAADAPAVRPPPASPPKTGPDTVDRLGHPMRHFAVAISSEAMAMAWANQEDAPQGAVVVVDHEINPRGLHGRLWDSPPSDTQASSIVLRPPVSAEEGDVSWLVAGLAALEAAEDVTGRQFATWWPDEIVDADSKDPVAATRAEVQLGPGQVKSAVITLRLDLVRLGLDGDGRDRLLDALIGAADRLCGNLTEGAAATAAVYESRCSLMGERVKVRLRPKGETRGVVRRVDKAARLEIEAMSGMLERVGVDQLQELTVVARPS